MPSGLREHPRHYLRLPDLLRGRSHQRQSLQGGMDEHRRWLLQEEERSSRNPVITLGPALKPLLAVLVLASAVAAPVLAEESRTLEEKLLGEEVSAGCQAQHEGTAVMHRVVSAANDIGAALEIYAELTRLKLRVADL